MKKFLALFVVALCIHCPLGATKNQNKYKGFRVDPKHKKYQTPTAKFNQTKKSQALLAKLQQKKSKSS